MSRYDGWSKEDLAWKCRELEREVEDLEKRLKESEDENYSLRFKINTELEPRLQHERRAYDSWVTDPER